MEYEPSTVNYSICLLNRPSHANLTLSTTPGSPSDLSVPLSRITPSLDRILHGQNMEL